MPLAPSKSIFYSCCCKVVCRGCEIADRITSGGDNCPFCREPAVNGEENDKRVMKRVKANDPVAMSQVGETYYDEGDYGAAFEYLTKAAGFEDAAAHFKLGCMYSKGEGVQKDEEKMVYHWEMAAIGGHPMARHLLAIIEEDNGNMERAVKHYIIAANLGHDNSLKAVEGGFADGLVSKVDYAAALRGHQAAIDATKSAQREEAEAFSIRLTGL